MHHRWSKRLHWSPRFLLPLHEHFPLWLWQSFNKLWISGMFLVLISSDWNSQRPELGKKWLTHFQTNKCWEQARSTPQLTGHIGAKGLFLHIGPLQVLLQNVPSSLSPQQNSVGIPTLFHILKYWKLSMPNTGIIQAKLNTSDLHCR